MKTVKELTREQLIELKQNYLTKKMDEKGESPSYGELAEAGWTITDDEIFKEYDGTMFSDDDFMCSCGDGGTDNPTILDAWIVEMSPNRYLHMNVTEDGNGTWFDDTESIWEAYWNGSLDDIKEIAETEFSDYSADFPKYHKVRFTYKITETIGG